MKTLCRLLLFLSVDMLSVGDVSPVVDVHAFGVVLCELISAREALIKETGSDAEMKSIVSPVTYFRQTSAA